MPVFALLMEDAVLARVMEETLAPLGQVVPVKEWDEAFRLTPEAILAEDILFARKPNKKQENTRFLLFSIGGEVQDPAVDESFVKPLRLGHLAARVQLHLTAQKKDEDLCFAIGEANFFPARRLIEWQGKSETMTEKESALLAALAAAEGACGRDALLAEIWGYDPRTDTHTLETHIYRLRTLANLRDRIRGTMGMYELDKK